MDKPPSHILSQLITFGTLNVINTSQSHFTEKDTEASKKLPGVFKTIFVTLNKNMFDKIKKSHVNRDEKLVNNSLY